MFQTDDLRAKFQLQVFPGGGTRQLAEAAHGVRTGAMDEQQNGRLIIQHCIAGNQILRSQYPTVPAVKSGRPGQLTLNGSHQCRCAFLRSPVYRHVSGFLLEQFLGQISDAVVFEHQLPDLPPDPIRGATVLALNINEAGKVD
ncbi:hypothetical protein D3C76_516020 [compost metagenome]